LRDARKVRKRDVILARPIILIPHLVRQARLSFRKHYSPPLVSATLLPILEFQEEKQIFVKVKRGNMEFSQIKTTVEHCMDTVAQARQAFSVSDKNFTASKVQSWVWEYSVVRAFSVSRHHHQSTRIIKPKL
jgi:hypothetical protein